MGGYTIKIKNKMIEREKLCYLIFNEPLKKADAIILLTGDGYFRLAQALNLYQQKWAPKIVISGGTDDISYGSIHAEKIANKLVKMGMLEKDIVIEAESRNTREQAINVMDLAKKNKWKRILLVASPHHQLRAFLTFLKAMEECGIKLEIINSSAQNLSWFEKNKWGRRIDWLESEFEKIKKYKKHMISFSEALLYQEWKEKQK